RRPASPAHPSLPRPGRLPASLAERPPHPGGADVISTELIFARHGEAQCNVDAVVGGPRTCTGLTDLGRHQMRLTATRLATEHRSKPFTHIYAGPRRRLRESGRILADALDQPLIISTLLDGPVHGDADG